MGPFPGTSNTNAITLEPQYATIGTDNSVMLTTLYDDGTAHHEIIDVEVNEKRKRDDNIGQQGRRVRFRDDETPTPSPSAPPAPPAPPAPSGAPVAVPPGLPQPAPAPFSAPIPPVPGQASPPQRAAASTEPAEAGSRNTQKFRLASELNETTPIAKIGEKLMDTPVALTLREVLAASSEVSTYVYDMTRKRRRVIDPNLEAMVMPTEPVPTSVPPVVHINASTITPMYACPSGRAKVMVDGHLRVDALLDNGSEVNLMPQRIFEQLDLPIDTDIGWKINTFTTGSDTEAHGCLGVCHAVPVDIGGVEVRIPIFIVENSNQDLLLGRPWERMVRASFANDDEGNYICRIKSPDGRRIVQFTAAKADHHRNRSFARDADGAFPIEHLKV
jgi:hypothetical protein